MECVDVEEEVFSVELGDGQTAAIERVRLRGGGTEPGIVGVVGLAACNSPVSNECVGLVWCWESGGR